MWLTRKFSPRLAQRRGGEVLFICFLCLPFEKEQKRKMLNTLIKVEKETASNQAENLEGKKKASKAVISWKC